MTFGNMQLTLQQGTVTSYDRSLLLLDAKAVNKRNRILPGGVELRALINQAALGSRVEALYPAYRPSLSKDVMTLHPVWVVRLANGSVKIVAESKPAAGT
jgi:regulatory protein YycH of two-component signal transduction system YycFG